MYNRQISCPCMQRINIQTTDSPILSTVSLYFCVTMALFVFAGSPPVRMSGLKPGPHRLKITHYRGKDECGYRRQLFLDFEIEDTPDNPHNNI